ncbi:MULTISPECIES: hypothetical protein [Pseudomonas]|jgi:hypothetical protein|uniref:Uncharacterized protein n=1 Tax=Serpens gallinarum TaxID=2763075 RepID=A0ABR8TRS5_9PSED|nr:hypothetical protein [Serpens gallinarum]MBD7978180.1 hypothetical protein [Serpens gallinarum]
MKRYEVAFAGRLQPGVDPARVRANLAQLFQADESRIEALFSGRRVVIKNNLDEVAAEKYRAALARAGAVAEVCPQDAELPQEIEQSAYTAQPRSVSVPAPGRLEVVPRDEYMAAFSAVQAPDFGLAPVGADLQDVTPSPTAPAIHVSALALLPVGSDLGQRIEPVVASVPDSSHLRVLD